jgi:hypothetical protein
MAQTPERLAFYKKVEAENVSCLCNVLGDLITPRPQSTCRPFL